MPSIDPYCKARRVDRGAYRLCDLSSMICQGTYWVVRMYARRLPVRGTAKTPYKYGKRRYDT